MESGLAASGLITVAADGVGDQHGTTTPVEVMRNKMPVQRDTF
jgi:hypothetical protein